jgi:hypothetical protein
VGQPLRQLAQRHPPWSGQLGWPVCCEELIHACLHNSHPAVSCLLRLLVTVPNRATCTET